MKEALKKMHKAVLWYAIGMTPVTVAYSLWFFSEDRSSLAHRLFNNLGFVWLCSLVYLIAALVLYKGFRERLLTRLAGFRERDEREQQVTADSARATFLLMLAIEIVFLLMSVTNVRIERQRDGHGTLSVGLTFGASQTDLYSPKPVPTLVVEAAPPGSVTAAVRLLPPPCGGVMLLLIVAQLLAFKLFAAKRYKGLPG